MKSVIKYFVIMILACILLCGVDIVQVDGASMQPTINDGDYVIINDEEIKEGDVVVIHVDCKYGFSSEYIIKRVWDIDENGNIYVLGDNYKNSLDSRTVGYLPGDIILGKVIYHFSGIS